MPLFDLSGDELTTTAPLPSRPPTSPPSGRTRLAGSREKARPATVTRVANGLTLVDTYDVTFSGFDGDPIRAWFHRPAGTDDTALPVVVRYQGYGGGRGLSHQVQPWPLAGYACLQVDTRGQGSGYSPGHTPDPAGSAPAHPGYLTRGILDPATYYYRRVFTDAVLAVDAAQQLAGVDREQGRRGRWQPGRRHRPRGRGSAGRPDRRARRRTVPGRLPPGQRDRRRAPVHRAHVATSRSTGTRSTRSSRPLPTSTCPCSALSPVHPRWCRSR